MKAIPLRLSPIVQWAAAPPLCLFIITIALSPSLQKWTPLIPFFCLTVIFLTQERPSLFLIPSLYVVVFLEVAFNLKISESRGISFMNIILFGSLLLIILKNLREDERLFQECPLNRPLFALAVWAFITMAISCVRGLYPAPRVIDFLFNFKNYFNFLLIFLITFNLPRSRREIRTLWSLFLALFILSIFLNVLAYYGYARFIPFLSVKPQSLGTTVYGAYEQGLRLEGLLKEPNVFGSFLALFIPSLITSSVFSRKCLARSFFLVASFFSVFVLILTGSRGAYMGVLASLAILLVLLRKIGFLRFKQMITLLVLLLLFLAVLLIFYDEPFKANLIARFTLKEGMTLDTLSHRRFTLWREGLTAFRRNPILGTGALPDVIPHNNFIYYLIHLGVIGLILYLLIYFRMFRLAYRGLDFKGAHFRNLLNLSFLAGLGGVLTAMFFVEIIHVQQFIFLAAGMAFRYNLLKDDLEE